jgi:hypothetical protein
LDRDLFAQYSGDVLGPFALGDGSVTEEHLYQAVSISQIATQETPKGILSPYNPRIVELFITP